MTQIIAQENNTSVILKKPRDNASQDCFWSISYVRRRVQELEENPVFKLILQKEPNPRESYTRASPNYFGGVSSLKNGGYLPFLEIAAEKQSI
jgi:hypothetical protein